MKRGIILPIVAIICALYFSALPARGTLITIEITAEVDAVADTYGHLEGNINVGDIITGTYIYESTTPDSSPSSRIGNYWHYGPPSGIFLAVGGFEFKTNPSNVVLFIGVVDNYPPEDNYALISENNLPLANGTYVGGISWFLEDPAGNAISTDALPTTAPVLADWQSNFLTFGGGTDEEPFGISADVTSAVPEPATIVLLAVGALLLRKRH